MVAARLLKPTKLSALLIFLTVFCLIRPVSAQAAPAWFGSFVRSCGTALRFGQTAQEQELKERRHTELLKLFIDPQLSGLTELSTQQRAKSAIGLYGEPLNILSNGLQGLFINGRVPAKEILKLLQWMENQPGDFAQDYYERLLLALQENASTAIGNPFYSRFFQLVEQDPNSKEPKFKLSHEDVFRNVDMAQLHKQIWTQKLIEKRLERSLDEEDRRLVNNDFFVDRGEQKVEQLLGFRFDELIPLRKRIGNWFDVGAGLALFQRQVLHRLGPLAKGKMFAIAIKKPDPKDASAFGRETSLLFDPIKESKELDEDLERFSSSFAYVDGLAVEDREDLPANSGFLTTDIMGALHYTRDLRKVLMAEAGVLQKDGWLVSHRSNNQIVTPSGEVLDWYQYAAKYGKGLKLKVRPPRPRFWLFDLLSREAQSSGAALQRNGDELSLPELELIHVPYTSAPPPARIYYCARCL